MSTKEETYKNKFNETFKEIVDELVTKDENDAELAPAASWLRHSLEYNTNDGKKARGMMVLMCFDYLKGSNISDDEMHKACVLGWCIELLQAVFLIADDIMDGSELRRGKPCWYKKCGLQVVNDTFLIEAGIYKLLKSHFRDSGYYIPLVEAFHDITYKTAMGQELDLLASDPNKPMDLNLYTMDRYKSIVKYKTAYYSFYLPISLGMIMAGKTEQVLYDQARVILMEVGEYFQIQDDYLDCYGDPEVTGKVGTDIEDAKCSWLVVKCLEKCSASDRTLLDKHYGKKESEDVKKVKDLFERNCLKKEFLDYEDNSYKKIQDMVEQSTNENGSGQMKGIIQRIITKIYKRQK